MNAAESVTATFDQACVAAGGHRRGAEGCGRAVEAGNCRVRQGYARLLAEGEEGVRGSRKGRNRTSGSKPRRGRAHRQRRHEKGLAGRSVAGRPIVAYEVGNSASSRRELVVGCINGRPRGSPSPEGSSGCVTIVHLWVVPVLNPDGVAAGTRGTRTALTSTGTSRTAGRCRAASTTRVRASYQSRRAVLRIG